MIETRDGEYWVYRCEKCGREYRYTKPKKVVYCGHQAKPKLPPETNIWDKCEHRGKVLANITGRVAGCSCRSVRVYQCERFAEPVLKTGKPPCEDSIQEQVPGWKGRTCKHCEIPKERESDRQIRQDMNEDAAADFGEGATIEMICEPVPMYTMLFGPHRIVKRASGLDALYEAAYAFVNLSGRQSSYYLTTVARNRLRDGGRVYTLRTGGYIAQIHGQTVGTGETVEECLLAADRYVQANGRPKPPSRGCSGGG